MAKLTLDNVKAPRFEEFPKLARIKADVPLERAIAIKLEIASLQEELAKLAPRIQAKLDQALDEETKSIVYVSEASETGCLFTRTSGGETKRLDTKWAKRRLLQKGVLASEIEEHTKVSVREPGLRVQLLGEGGADEGGESDGDE